MCESTSLKFESLWHKAEPSSIERVEKTLKKRRILDIVVFPQKGRVVFSSWHLLISCKTSTLTLPAKKKNASWEYYTLYPIRGGRMAECRAEAGGSAGVRRAQLEEAGSSWRAQEGRRWARRAGHEKPLALNSDGEGGKKSETNKHMLRVQFIPQLCVT